MLPMICALAMMAGNTSAPAASDTAAVRALATRYFDALERGRPTLLQKAFYADANLYWVGADGRLQSYTQTGWRKKLSTMGPQKARSRKIVDLQVDHDVAMIKTVSDMGNHFFVDYLLAIKASRHWEVVNKTFTRVADLSEASPTAPDLEAIRQVLRWKIEASVQSDGGLLRLSHHPRTVYYTLVNDVLAPVSIAEHVGRYEERRASHPAAPHWRIVSIDQSGNVANAKLDATLGDTRYVDFINLIKLDGHWKIISAVWK